MAMATCAHVYTVYCARYAMQRHAMVCFKALDGRQCISKKGSREGARGARRPEERVGSYPASQPATKEDVRSSCAARPEKSAPESRATAAIRYGCSTCMHRMRIPKTNAQHLVEHRTHRPRSRSRKANFFFFPPLTARKRALFVGAQGWPIEGRVMARHDAAL